MASQSGTGTRPTIDGSPTPAEPFRPPRHCYGGSRLRQSTTAAVQPRLLGTLLLLLYHGGAPVGAYPPHLATFFLCPTKWRVRVLTD